MKSTKRVTSALVARRAGVSKWTVIRAFTPGAAVAAETRKRVLQIAETLNYRPNLLARSLATNQTHLIAILVDDFANPYKLPTLDRLTASLQSEGMLGVLVNINRDFDHLEAITNAKQRRFDAVVLFGTAFREPMLATYATSPSPTPMYVLARESAIGSIPSVNCDADRAMQEICDHLYARGYRRPGFMSGPRSMSTVLGRRRFYMQFWRSREAGPIAEIKAERYDRNVAAEAMRAYLASTPAAERCDVVMCENDILAMGALDLVRSEFGLSVPKDMAVVGYDGIDLAGMRSFALTTYEQPYETMVDVLVDMIMGRRPRESVRLPGRLVIRNTT